MSLTTEEARELGKRRAAKHDASWTQEEIDEVLMAIIAFAGNVQAAHRWLVAEGKRTPTDGTMRDWRRTKHLVRYDQLREKFHAQIEDNLAHDMRDVARLAVEAERVAIAKAQERLESGEEPDPARAAANLSRVAQSSTDKLMTLTSRPTQITENRNLGEIVRGLVARGILTLPDEPEEQPAQIENPAGGDACAD